ncbi:hypothetical protein [Paenibacillus sp. S29]
MVDIGSEQYLFHTGHGYWLAPGESYQIAPLNGTVPEYYKITFEVIDLPSEPQADMALGEHAVRMPSLYHGPVLPSRRTFPYGNTPKCFVKSQAKSRCITSLSCA